MSKKPASYIETKTMNLRFVERGTRNILQQLMVWHSLDHSTGGQEWVDVPCIGKEPPEVQ